MNEVRVYALKTYGAEERGAAKVLEAVKVDTLRHIARDLGIRNLTADRYWCGTDDENREALEAVIMGCAFAREEP